jgi:hypothetical protein
MRLNEWIALNTSIENSALENADEAVRITKEASVACLSQQSYGSETKLGVQTFRHSAGTG